MTEIFRPALIQAAADKTLDRAELNQLRTLRAQLKQTAPSSEEARLAQRTLQTLDQYTTTTRLNLPLGQVDGKTQFIDFTLTPLYSESERIPGKTPLEIVANLSQGDSLSETQEDNVRCAAATILNAYLLLGGKFEELPAKLGLGSEYKDATYANAHYLQEALYKQANVNGGQGLNISDNNRYDWETGRVLRAEIVGESRIAAQKLGMKTHALMGDHKDRLTQREKAVKAFLAEHPKAALYVTVKGGPRVTAPQDFEKYDHAVTVYHEKGKFYLIDSGVNDNGGSRALRVLNAADVKELLYNNQGYVFGLSFDPASEKPAGKP